MMAKELMHRQKGESRKKGLIAGAGWTGTAVLGGLTIFATWPWWLAAAAGAGSVYLTWRWLRYRAEWGMRF